MVYTGFQQVLTPLQADMLTVPTSLESGIIVSAVEALLASGTRRHSCYVVTDGHNPLGMSMGRSERIRLVNWRDNTACRLLKMMLMDSCTMTKTGSPRSALWMKDGFFMSAHSRKILAPACASVGCGAG
jgi:hypothetical protein